MSETEWISFFGPQLPENGQKIFYYGGPIGVWRGRYSYDPRDTVRPHRMVCGERSPELDTVLAEYGLDGLEMTVDRMDAPWWMPDSGQDKPDAPAAEYPPDYPAETSQ